MTDENVNEIIAEYMGHDVLACLDSNLGFYTESLDALVPVWEKYNQETYISGGDSIGFDCIKLYIMPVNNSAIFMGYEQKSHNFTIQQAAAYATAKAIKKLK